MIVSAESRLWRHPGRLILVLVALINLSLALTATSWLSHSREHYHEEAAGRARNTSRIIELSVTATLRGIDQAMQSMAVELAKCRTLTAAACGSMHAILEERSLGLREASAFHVIDADGGVVAVDADAATDSGDLSRQQFFQTLKAEMAPTAPPASMASLSRPHRDQLNGRWQLDLGRPIRGADQRFLGAVLATVDLERLQSLLLAAELGPNGALSLRDDAMGVILRVPEPKGIGTNIGARNISPQLAAMLAQKLPSGVYRAVTPLDGIERTVAFSRSPDYPLYVNVGLSAEDYLQPWRQERNRVLAMMLFLIGLTSTAGLLLWRMYRRQQGELAQRRRAEEALRQSEEKFRSLVDGIPLGITLIGRDGHFNFHNPAFTRILGYTPEDIPNSVSWLKKAYPDRAYRQEVMDTWRREIVREGQEGHVVRSFEVCDARGEKRDIQFSVVTLPDRQAIVTYEDVTERNCTARIHASILQTALDGFWLVNNDGRMLEVNESACQMLGYSNEELRALYVHDVDAIADAEGVLRRMKRIAADGQTRFHSRHRCKDGHLIDVEVSVIHLAREHLFCVFVRDITAHKKAEENLRLAACVYANSQEGIIITNPQGEIIDVNPAFSRLTGYPREEVIGQNSRFRKSDRHSTEFYAAMWSSLRTRGAWQGEIWNRNKSGEISVELLSIDRVCGARGQVQYYVGVFSDISRLKAHEAELDRIAYYDPLTGVPNRRLLSDRLGLAVARARRSGKPMAVCYLDIDGFKPINDHFGHAAGDRILIEVTARLQAILQGEDAIARLGGDEFVLLLNEIDDKAACIAVLEQVLLAAAAPCAIEGSQVSVSASIGVALFPEDDTDPDTLLRHADQAMYQAKQAGRNRYHFFDPEHDRRASAQQESLRRIAQALERQEFVLHYQPKVNLLSGGLVGLEALIRWQHPERGLLAPALFLPLVEGTELDVQIGEWVIGAALRQIASWLDAGIEIAVSVNIGATQLLKANFTETLAASLRAWPRVPAHLLSLEVLESAAITDLEQAARTLEACRQLGVHFSLDDFGTGYSSLIYFRKLPISQLKIDQAFVRNMLDDPNDRQIVESVVRLAAAFNCEVIAEGAESLAHCEALLDLGCPVVQGYGIARPLPAADIPAWREAWLRRQNGYPTVAVPAGISG